MNTLRIDHSGGVVQVTLNRPARRNAFDAEMISELTQTFRELGPATRVVVLAGEGAVFCAGADLAWMQQSRDYSEDENIADAQRLADMFAAVDNAACVVMARVQGAAYGGGAGLAACCDIVVADENTRFGFTEVRLGLIPAVVSPFVIRRMGQAQARRYFLTGEVFTAERALRIGLVDEVVPASALEGVVAELTQSVLRAGPGAVAAAKRLVQVVAQHAGQAKDSADSATIRTYTTRAIAALRVQPEAQEGLRAFFEKRDPRWS